LLGPVAHTLGIDLVWFGVLLAVNMQTSFMHPPFGFALFYLRSVAPISDYIDKITNRPVKRVTIGQIYWGSIPFVCIQIIMIAMVIAFPVLVTGGLDHEPQLDSDQILQELHQIQDESYGPAAPMPNDLFPSPPEIDQPLNQNGAGAPP